MQAEALSLGKPRIRVILYGSLAERFGPEFKLAVSSIAEAIRLLEANFRGRFYKAIKDGQYHVVRGSELESGEGLNHEQLRMNLAGQDLHIVPALHGASKSGKAVFAIILGVVLIAGAFILSGGLAAPGIAAAFAGMSGTVWGTVATVGASLAIGGIASLLTPVQQQNLTPPDIQNTFFSGPVNVTTLGNCVTVVYGRCIGGTTTISASMHLDQVQLAH
jgi:predicted phage tail protein